MHNTGFFFTGAPLKVLSVRLQSKSYQKSSKCQNLLTGWHVGFLGGHQFKKKHPVFVFGIPDICHKICHQTPWGSYMGAPLKNLSASR